MSLQPPRINNLWFLVFVATIFSSSVGLLTCLICCFVPQYLHICLIPDSIAAYASSNTYSFGNWDTSRIPSRLRSLSSHICAVSELLSDTNWYSSSTASIWCIPPLDLEAYRWKPCWLCWLGSLGRRHRPLLLRCSTFVFSFCGRHRPLSVK